MAVDEFASPEDFDPLTVSVASEAAWYVPGESVVIDNGYMVR